MTNEFCVLFHSDSLKHPYIIIIIWLSYISCVFFFQLKMNYYYFRWVVCVFVCLLIVNETEWEKLDSPWWWWWWWSLSGKGQFFSCTCAIWVWRWDVVVVAGLRYSALLCNSVSSLSRDHYVVSIYKNLFIYTLNFFKLKKKINFLLFFFFKEKFKKIVFLCRHICICMKIK